MSKYSGYVVEDALQKKRIPEWFINPLIIQAYGQNQEFYSFAELISFTKAVDMEIRFKHERECHEMVIKEEAMNWVNELMDLRPYTEEELKRFCNAKEAIRKRHNREIEYVESI